MQYTNPTPTGDVRIDTPPSTTEAVIGGMDATSIVVGVACTVTIDLWVSMSLPGATKASVARLRDGGPTGTVLATSQTFPDHQHDVTTGHDDEWSWSGSVTPTTSRLCVTIQSSNTNATQVWSDTRTFTVSGNPARPLGQIDLTNGTSLFEVSESPAPGQLLGADLSGRGFENFRLPVLDDLDPITNLPAYRLIVVDMHGQPQYEVPQAVVQPIKWSINDKGSVSFQVPNGADGVSELRVPEREVQVWLGGRFLWWGVIVRATGDEATVTFQCQTLEWYFDRRVVGPVPRTGVFKGVHMEYGTGVWAGGFFPGSDPKGLPLKDLSRDQSIAGGNSMILAPSGGRTVVTAQADDWFTDQTGSTLSSAGHSALDDIITATFGDAPSINVSVWHDGSKDWKVATQITQDRWQKITDYIHAQKPSAKVSGQGYGEKQPVAPNATPAGRAQNRRVKVTYRNTDAKKGHQQFVYQEYPINVPADSPHYLKATLRGWVFVEDFEAPAANNWGMMLDLVDPSKPHKNPKMAAKGFKKVVIRTFQPISPVTPLHMWIRMEAALNVPNDGKDYVLIGRLFPPTGMAYFDECDLFLDESLDYQNEEQANIMRDLVDHAQDVSLGKSDLNIGHRILGTGVKRTRRYYYGERTVIGDNLNEFSGMGDGMEWDIVCTPTTRTLKSYYPRKQRNNGYVLALGSNISGFTVDVDGATTSNVVVVMANDFGEYAREERSASDTSLLEGTVMEIAYQATPGSSVSSLSAQAKRGLERYRKPTTTPQVVSNPAYMIELLNNTQTGDIVMVDVRTAWFQTLTEYRILDMTLDPATSQITYTLMPEDTPIRVLSGWGQTWKYKTRSQITSTGAQNGSPKPTMPQYAARDYDDSGWATGQAGFGWFRDGDNYSQAVSIEPNTTIPDANELWMRKTVLCTEEMYVSLNVDQFAYVYVNGNLVQDRYFIGANFDNKFLAGSIRVDQEFLDPSGIQQITVHVQDRLSDRPENPAALYGDCKVRGIYNPDHVTLVI